ncbi:MAG TPA: SET domain-containing protein-lysine N-methyltransferase [Acidimicrobiales bacterium]|nr:SET domain-containing protein-lysine N-methyltransferase [Acidimicrobiales bacterium]
MTTQHERTSSEPVSSYISPKAAKGRPSRIAGRGLFAVEPIARDEVVAVKGGRIVTGAELALLPAELRESDVQISDDLHLAATTPEEYEAVMLFLNHSCEPNVGIDGNVVFVAMRDVVPGEELTTDYAFFDDSDAVMACCCGAQRCRGEVTGRDWRRPEVRVRYEVRHFSSYLQRRILAPSGAG